MDHLRRAMAPVSDAAWQAIEEEARTRLVTHLAARKLVDFSGPHGWTHAATNLGRAEPASALGGVSVRRRRVLPLAELRVPFALSRAELDDVDRGAPDVDLGPLDEAVKAIALCENRTAFHGEDSVGMRGITQCSAHEALELHGSMDTYPRVVAQAADVLRRAGIAGPYGLALSPEIYTGIVETTEHGGYPLLDHLRSILDGPLVWAPGVDGGVVVSQRGGDFVFDCGQDLSIGYESHDAELVHLYIEETFSFRVDEPDAAVELRHMP